MSYDRRPFDPADPFMLLATGLADDGWTPILSMVPLCSYSEGDPIKMVMFVRRCSRCDCRGLQGLRILGPHLCPPCRRIAAAFE